MYPMKIVSVFFAGSIAREPRDLSGHGEPGGFAGGRFANQRADDVFAFFAALQLGVSGWLFGDKKGVPGSGRRD
jgi:hypothetical protein